MLSTVVDKVRAGHIFTIGCMVLFWVLSSQQVFAGVRINEIHYNPPGTDTNHEWIELWNDSDQAIDITNWKLFEDGSSHGLTFFQGNTVLQPDDFVVLTGSGSVFLQDNIGFSGNVAKVTFSLSNTGEMLEIRDGNGTMIDTVTYTTSFANGDGMTLERDIGGAFVASLEPGGTPGDWNTVYPTTIPTPSPTPVPTLSPTPSPAPTPSLELPTLFINEILPDPSSGDEWIELFNAGSTTIDLSTIAITDATNVPKALSGSVLSGEYRVIEPSPVSLNNTGDTITLLTSTGAILDQVAYGSVAKGKSVGRYPDISTGSGSIVTFGTPTRGGKNTINNRPPNPVITVQSPYKTSGSAPLSINVTAENSSDPDGDVLTYLWDYGEGYTTTGVNPGVYKYIHTGVFTLQLTVTDTFGLSSTTTQTITVAAATVSGGGGGGSAGAISSQALSCSPSNFQSRISLSALLINPSGSDEGNEYIELINQEDYQVNLCGWSIDDDQDGSGEYVFTRDTIIPAHGTLRISNRDSKITLNNEKDHARLFANNGSLIQDVAYEDAPDDTLYVFRDGKWVWENPLPIGGSQTIEQTVSTTEVNTSTLRINEVFPNPHGRDDGQEFIELFNPGNTDVALEEWSVSGRGGTRTFGQKKGLSSQILFVTTTTPTSIGDSNADWIIPAGGYLLISGTELGFALRNTTEEIHLIDPQGRIVQIISYTDAPEGESFNFVSNSGKWQWAEISPQRENNKPEIQTVPVDFSVELFQGKQMLFLRGETWPQSDVEIKLYHMDDDYTDDTVEPALELRAQSSQKVGSYSIGIRSPLDNGEYRILASVKSADGKVLSNADYTLLISIGATQYVKKSPVKKASTRKVGKKSTSAQKKNVAKTLRTTPTATSTTLQTIGNILPQFVDDAAAAGGPVIDDDVSHQSPHTSVYGVFFLLLVMGAASLWFSGRRRQ